MASPYKKCPACSQIFHTQFDLIKHLTSSHRHLNPQVESQSHRQSLSIQTSESQNILPFKCPICPNSRFSNRNRLIVHQRLAHQKPQQQQQQTNGVNKRSREIPNSGLGGPFNANKRIKTSGTRGQSQETERRNSRPNGKCHNGNSNGNSNGRIGHHRTFRFEFHPNVEEFLERHGLVRKPPAEPLLNFFPCHLCHRSYRSPIILNLHLNTAHKHSDNFYCSLCDSNKKGPEPENQANSGFIYLPSSFSSATAMADADVAQSQGSFLLGEEIQNFFATSTQSSHNILHQTLVNNGIRASSRSFLPTKKKVETVTSATAQVDDGQ